MFVDEYQDTDPGQVALLRALAGDGRNLAVVGDPHQSIYGFRGAEVRGILDFPDRVPARSTARPPTWSRCAPPAGSAHGCCRPRSGSPSGSRLPAPSPRRLDGRSVDPVAGSARRCGDGRVEVLTFDTERAETEHLADLLRRAHLEDGIAWSDMAVLVRSGRTSIPALRRVARSRPGVPVEVAADETPLVREPAVLPLLDALRAVVEPRQRRPEHADYVDPARAEALLLSPAGRARRRRRARALARLLRGRASSEQPPAGARRGPRPSCCARRSSTRPAR